VPLRTLKTEKSVPELNLAQTEIPVFSFDPDEEFSNWINPETENSSFLNQEFFWRSSFQN